MLGRGICHNISKAFHKVWHEGLLETLKQNGISVDLLNVITDFLCQRKQIIVLNGQHSSWTNVEVGIPEDLFLDHNLFGSISMTCLMV